MAAPQSKGSRQRHRARVSPRAVRRRPLRSTLVLVLLVVHLGGCFRYTPADFTTTPAGAEVLVTLTARGRDEMFEALGPAVERVDGRLLNVTDEEIVLAVSAVRHAELRDPVPWNGESVAIRRELVRDARERSLDRTRSWIAGGLALVGTIILSTITVRAAGGRDGGDGNPSGNGDDAAT